MPSNLHGKSQLNFLALNLNGFGRVFSAKTMKLLSCGQNTFLLKESLVCMKKITFGPWAIQALRPSSELYYDRGPKYGKANRLIDDPDSDRYLEFWIWFFMQYNRSSPTEIAPLPKPSIDTGAGLERILSLKMDVESVFETDVFAQPYCTS